MISLLVNDILRNFRMDLGGSNAKGVRGGPFRGGTHFGPFGSMNNPSSGIFDGGFVVRLIVSKRKRLNTAFFMIYSSSNKFFFSLLFSISSTLCLQTLAPLFSLNGSPDITCDASDMASRDVRFSHVPLYRCFFPFRVVEFHEHCFGQFFEHSLY